MCPCTRALCVSVCETRVDWMLYARGMCKYAQAVYTDVSDRAKKVEKIEFTRKNMVT